MIDGFFLFLGSAPPPPPPVDYVPVTMTFTFLMEDSQTFTVATLSDTIVEGDETLSVTITNINGPANAGPDLGLTIIDDDGKLPHPYINICTLH